MSAPATLRLEDIELDDSLQVRTIGLSEEHVLALMEASEAWPPIVVAKDGEAFVLCDGFHRVEAATRLGLESIAATVLEEPADRDYLQIAFEFNAKHGLSLTLRDRKAYAERLLRADPELSNREIGRRTGLNHETVGALRTGGDRQAGGVVIRERKPGEIPADIDLFDPVRRAKATRPQKAVAGYIQRLLDALEDPYGDDDETGVEGWSDNPAEIAQACFAAMGIERASRVLEALEYDADFILAVAKAREHVPQSA